MNDVALALGSGGVKGNAHIGVIRVLEREGFAIRAIAGTSAGGLWGSMYARGYSPEEILRRFSELDPDRIYQREPGDGPAWLGLAGVRELLEDTLGDCTFEDLRLPFAVTAVDLFTAEYIVIDSGCVKDAVLATIAVPGVFPPKVMNGRTLIDGGVLDPVPVALARRLAPGLPVVAVPLSAPTDEWGGFDRSQIVDSLPFLSNVVRRLRMTQAFNIYMRSMDIAGTTRTELLLQLEKPEVIIRPVVPNSGLLDHVDAAEVARIGERAAEEVLPALQRVVGWRARIHRRLLPGRATHFNSPLSMDIPE